MKKFNIRNNDHVIQITTLILQMVTSGHGEWTQIAEEVKKEFAVKNWLHIRSILQHLRDHNIVKRTEDLHTEIYVLGKEDPRLCNR